MITDRAEVAKRIEGLRAIVGGEADPVGRFWNGMTDRERGAWLTLARAFGFYASRTWSQIPADVRGKIRLAMRRAAARASMILDEPCTDSRH